MTADGVVSEGETEADDGPGEESEKHGLEININQARIYVEVFSTFSWWSISAMGLVIKYRERPRNANTPRRWVHMFP